MRCTRLGLVKYDTDLMSVAFHLSDVYNEQYQSVHCGCAKSLRSKGDWSTFSGGCTSRSKIQEKRHYVQPDYGDIKQSERKVRTTCPNQETINDARRHVRGYKYCGSIFLFRSEVRGNTKPMTITAGGSLAGEPYILAEMVGVVGILAFEEVRLFAVVAFEEAYPLAFALAFAPELVPAPELASAADTCTPFVVQRRFALGEWHVLPDRT